MRFKKHCPCCGLPIAPGAPFHNHMMKHVQAGKVVITSKIFEPYTYEVVTPEVVHYGHGKGAVYCGARGDELIRTDNWKLVTCEWCWARMPGVDRDKR